MTTIQLKIPILLDLLCVWPVLLYRLLKFGYPYRRIYLSDGLWTIVDADVYYRLGRFKWFLSGNGAKFYAVRSIKIGPGQTKTLRLHREIMNAPKGLLVDHKNRNTLDNRRANLRLATHEENMRNRGKRANTSSQYKGVRYKNDRRRRKHWQAIITVAGKRIYLGYYLTELEAAHAYDTAARRYHGEFARLNFSE